MKRRNQPPLRLLLVLAMALALLLGCLSGCGETKTQPEASLSASQAQEASSAPAEASAGAASAPETEPEASVSVPEAEPEAFASTSAEAAASAQAQPLEKEEPDAETAALLDGEDHAFEQEIAYRYYNGGETKNELADTERSQLLSTAAWDFDEEGHGVFVVGLDSSMSHTWVFVESTSDYGETWSAAGVYSVVTWVEDVKVAGNRVVLSVGNGVTESRHSLVYSDDLCQTFYERDTIGFAPSAVTDALEQDGSNVGMDLLSIDRDGSVVLGWYLKNHVSVSEFEDFDESARNRRDCFLIGRTDAALTQCQVLYAAANE